MWQMEGKDKSFDLMEANQQIKVRKFLELFSSRLHKSIFFIQQDYATKFSYFLPKFIKFSRQKSNEILLNFLAKTQTWLFSCVPKKNYERFALFEKNFFLNTYFRQSHVFLVHVRLQNEKNCRQRHLVLRASAPWW